MRSDYYNSRGVGVIEIVDLLRLWNLLPLHGSYDRDPCDQSGEKQGVVVHHGAWWLEARSLNTAQKTTGA